MANIVPFNQSKKNVVASGLDKSKTPKDNLHITEPEDYYVADVAIGIEIAIHLTGDRNVANFLMKKLNQAVNSNSLLICLNLHETRKYLDYLDIVNSTINQEWRLALAKFKYSN